MYKILKNVITSGNYELTGVLKKIDTIWAQDDITDEEKSELIELAREYADPLKSYAPLQKQIDILASEVKALREEVAMLKNGGSIDEETTEEYPEYVQPTGGHDAYKVGNKITYNGKKYECQIDGCVWTPDAYPQGWKLIEEVAEEETE